MKAKELRDHCDMDGSTKELLKEAIAQFNLSGREYDRILKVSRTVANFKDAGKLRCPCRGGHQLPGVQPEIVGMKEEKRERLEIQGVKNVANADKLMESRLT